MFLTLWKALRPCQCVLDTRRVWLAMALLLLTGLSACGGGGGNADPAPAVSPAVVVQQPADRSAVAGSAVSFSVVASNAVGYQWQSLGVTASTWADLAGATGATYTTPAAALAMDQTQYRVVVRGAAGDPVVSSAVRLTVTAQLQVPRIEVQPPAALDVVAGRSVSLSVTASGSQLSYTWQASRDGGTAWADLAWPSQATYTFAAAASSDNGLLLRVQVGNSAGVVTSAQALLTVRPVPVAPVFTQQPVDLSVLVGALPTFMVVADGTPRPSLQWQSSSDGSTWNNVGAAATTWGEYTLPAVTLAQNGLRLRAVASNSAGTTTSTVATLSVSGGATVPVITGNFADRSVQPGGTVLLSLAVSGRPTPTLQWQTAAPGSDAFININGATESPPTGSTQAIYATPALVLTDSGRTYRLVASNVAGQTASRPIRVTVGTPPQVRFDGHSAELVEQLVGSTPTLQVAVSGEPAPSIQWFVITPTAARTAVAGAVGTTYTPPASASQLTHFYSVEVRNAFGVTQTPLLAVVWHAPSAPTVSYPATPYATAIAGTTVTIGSGSVVSAWPAPTLLQWQVRRDGNGAVWADIPGANNATLVLASPALGDDGSAYRLVATNAVGSGLGPAWFLGVAASAVAPQAGTSSSASLVVVVGEVRVLDTPNILGGAVGVPMPSTVRQWSRDNGQTWRNFAASDRFGSAGSTVTAADDGLLLRAVSSNVAGTATSATLRLRVDTQGGSFWGAWPEDTTVTEGSIAKFTAKATSAGLDWQVSADGGANWSQLSAAMTLGETLLTLPVSTSDHGKQFRAVATAADGTQRVTGAARLNVLTAPAATLGLLAGHAGGRGQLDGRGEDTRLAAVDSITRDGAGNVYLVDVRQNPEAAYLRQLTPAGDLRTIYLPALPAARSENRARGEVPTAVAAADDGTLYIATRYMVYGTGATGSRTGGYSRIWRRSPAGALAVFAGGESGGGSIDGSGTAAGFSTVSGMALAADGSLLVSEGTFNPAQNGDVPLSHCIRKVSVAALVSTLAGLCDGSSGLRDGAGAQALFNGPRGIVVDAAGVVFVAEPMNGTVRRIAPDGSVSTVIGPLWPVRVPGGVAMLPGVPSAVALAPGGRLAVVNAGVQLVDPVAGTVEALPTGALSDAASILSDGSGGFWIGTGTSVYWGGAAEAVLANAYRQPRSALLLRFSGGATSLLAGLAAVEGSADGIGAAATFKMPLGLQPDRQGGVIVTDPLNFTVRRIDSSGFVSTLAGAPGVSGAQDGVGSAARFGDPAAVAVAADGTVFVADRVNGVVRRVAPDRSVITLAARFDRPSGIALAADGSLIVLDKSGLNLLQLDGRVQSHPAESSLTGAGGRFNRCDEGPLAVAPNGDIFVGCRAQILRVSPHGGVLRFGSGTGYADGAADAARFGHVTGLAVDDAGRLWVADALTQSLRRIDSDGWVTTVVGRSELAYPPDTLNGGWHVLRGGTVLGASPRLGSVMGVAWLGNNRLAVASENGVFVATVP